MSSRLDIVSLTNPTLYKIMITNDLESKAQIPIRSKKDLSEIRLISALALVSLGRGSARALFDATVAWEPVREMIERVARG